MKENVPKGGSVCMCVSDCASVLAGIVGLQICIYVEACTCQTNIPNTQKM